jgi:DNA-binding response OmpR family regulator
VDGGDLNLILIIDDDPVTLAALPALISSRLPDTVVDTALTGDAALALLRTSPYQLILLDVHMSGIDGLTLLRQFRTDVAETPVIVITANLTESVETEASQAGTYAFLPKPAFPDVVIAKVQAALQRTQP